MCRELDVLVRRDELPSDLIECVGGVGELDPMTAGRVLLAASDGHLSGRMTQGIGDAGVDVHERASCLGHVLGCDANRLVGHRALPRSWAARSASAKPLARA